MGRRNQWATIKWDDIPFEQLSRSKKRKRLFTESMYACSQCGFNKTRECGGSILEIDHIDGDHTNNSYDNLRVLCPNCHALTPNFRNWGRPRSEGKTSTRVRKGNAGYEKMRDEKVSLYRRRKEEFEVEFIRTVHDLHNAKEIDFGSYGWVQKLADKTGEHPQVVGRRVKKLMPEFYEEHCFTRYKK